MQRRLPGQVNAKPAFALGDDVDDESGFLLEGMAVRSGMEIPL